MPYIYDEATNEQINVDDIRGFVVTNPKNEIVYAKDLGDTSQARNLLSIAQTPLATTWDYMPKNSKDIAQSVALETMTDSGAIQLAKILGGVVGGVAGGGVGAGLGYLMVEAGLDIYNWIDKAGDNPNKFWNDFADNMKDRADDNEFQKFIGGMNLGGSFTGSGASEGLFQDWGDVIGDKGFATGVGEVIGTLTRSAATVLAGGQTYATQAIIADVSLTSATRETAEMVGMGEDVWKALGSGAIHGVASGITGAAFISGLPALFRTHAPALMTSVENSTMASVAATSAEFAAWGLTEENLISLAEGEGFQFDPMRFGAAAALGAGFGLMLKGPWLNKSPKEEANQVFRKEPPAIHTTLENHYSHDELAKMGYRMLKADKMTNNNGFVTAEIIQDRIKRQHYDIKNSGMSQNSADIMAKNYGVAAPGMGRTWTTPEPMNFELIKENTVKAVTSEYFKRDISEQARFEINSKVAMLKDIGAIRTEEQASKFTKGLMDVALKDNKGSIGGYEVRKAFDKVMRGGR